MLRISTVIDLEFYSLSTGRPHPLVKGQLPKDIWNLENFTLVGFVITIMEDFVGILTVNKQFFICNWKTGKIHAKHNFTLEDSIHDFFFLDHSRYVIVRGDHNPPEVRIHYLPTENTDPKDSTPLAIYHLPKMQDDVGVRIQSRSDPPPPCRNPTVDISPIEVQLEERILIFSISTQTAQFLGSFLLCVRAETLMTTPPDAQKDENGTVIVTSDLWMQKTRMLPDWISPHNWMCYVYGSRFVTFAYIQSDPGKQRCQIFILEFSPKLIGQALEDDRPLLGEFKKPESNWSFFTTESSRDPDTFLAESWTHALPIMRIITSIKYDVAPEDQLVVMLDQERLITIMVSSPCSETKCCCSYTLQLRTDGTSHIREPYMLDIHHPVD
jgi:hypothetical protein